MTRRRRASRLGGTASPGFTLVEVLVSLLVLSLVFALAAGLLIDSLRILGASVGRARNPQLSLAAELLRADLKGAQSLGGSAGGALSLAITGSTVRWWRDGEVLWRETVRPGGKREPRPVVGGVRSFRWQPAAGGTVAVEIVAEIRQEATVRLLTSRLSRREEAVPQSVSFVVARRTRGGASGW